jgi:hypothetical protein
MKLEKWDEKIEKVRGQIAECEAKLPDLETKQKKYDAMKARIIKEDLRV